MEHQIYSIQKPPIKSNVMLLRTGIIEMSALLIKEHLILHIWQRKEIENYFIIPEILFKLIPTHFGVSYNEFLSILEKLLDSQYDNTFDAYASQYRIDCKDIDEGQQWDVTTCNQNARTYLRQHWNTLNDKISLVGGKDFLSVLSQYYQKYYKAPFTIKKNNKRINT